MQLQTVLYVIVAITLVLVVVFLREERGIRVALVTDSLGNEAIVTKATMRRQRMLFLVDTAYAGAPVLS
ncbi:hypothetical protein EBR57_09680, partial [bacterium]|nr:hypothetical protein [bacterium]